MLMDLMSVSPHFFVFDDSIISFEVATLYISCLSTNGIRKLDAIIRPIAEELVGIESSEYHYLTIRSRIARLYDWHSCGAPHFISAAAGDSFL